MQINVMIVDDSLLIRAILKQLIENDSKKRFKVVASAKDGNDALAKLSSFNVDVITMDIEMPNKNGIEALKEIMTSNPKPVVMLSSLTKKGAVETIEALSLGAFDFITKPETQLEFKGLEVEIQEKLWVAHHATKTLTKKNNNINQHAFVKTKSESKSTLTNLILIGCSTGGPKALRRIVEQIPPNFPGSIVVVQHMPKGGYTASLAEHLNSSSHFTVKEAKDGEEIKDGTILIAPGGYHVEIFNRGGKYRTVLNQRDPIFGLRPSVDIMLSSAARLKTEIPIYSAILTGMGSDGVKGIKALKSIGAYVIAESEETAIVYGMPKQIVENGYADVVLELDEIVPHLIKKTK